MRRVLHGEMAAVLDTETLHGRPLPRGGTVVVASGVCSLCDSRFRNERVLAWPSRRLPAGWLFVELRHLDEAAAPSERAAPTTEP